MTEPDTITYIREQYLTQIHSITGRNVIAYYFGWLKTSDAPHVSIDEQDKNAFMTTVYKLDKAKGLDFILHTSGGDIAATESIVTYLKSLLMVTCELLTLKFLIWLGIWLLCPAAKL